MNQIFRMVDSIDFHSPAAVHMNVRLRFGTHRGLLPRVRAGFLEASVRSLLAERVAVPCEMSRRSLK